MKCLVSFAHCKQVTDKNIVLAGVIYNKGWEQRGSEAPESVFDKNPKGAAEAGR